MSRCFGWRKDQGLGLDWQYGVARTLTDLETMILEKADTIKPNQNGMSFTQADHGLTNA